MPNIVWITSEDHGPHMGCYGDKLARTPNVDALANKGMTFLHAWSCAPVCAPARTAIISGMYPASTGGIHMRSMVPMPNGAKMYPEYLREKGYFCTNNSKEDYNLVKPKDLWNESSGKAHWRNRTPGQPFFAVFNSTKSHESQIRTRPHTAITDPKAVSLPKYHPDTPEVRLDWAQYYDKVSEADADAGKVIQQLEQDGLMDETIIFYYADHGSGMPRSKRWPSNSGLQVPMVVYFPEKWKHLAPAEYKPGTKSERLVNFVDLAPTLLSIAGIKPPAMMQGHAFAGSHQTSKQPYLFGERGRMDERYDMVRSVTDGRYVYLRNFYPQLSQAQQVAYQFETPTTQIWRDKFDRGETDAAQSIFWKIPKDVEEFYDLQSDPDETNNLADRPEQVDRVSKFREACYSQMRNIHDTGLLPEGEMHRRAAGGSPYDLTHSPSFPFDKLFEAALTASDYRLPAASELHSYLADADSVVRYWGAIGLLIRGGDTIRKETDSLRKLLDDSSPFVRIAAAECLATAANDDELARPLDVIIESASPEKYGVFAGMAGLSAIEAIGKRAASTSEAVASMSGGSGDVDTRFKDYIPRLKTNLERIFGGEANVESKDKGEKKDARKKTVKTF
jgi:uncharacterized sulfatase